MTPAAEILRDQILRGGPISFRTFMETALYHSDVGYYRRDRFGKSGDFYTAEQLQPVFGILVAASVRRLHRETGDPFTIVELGAGREEMRPYFSEWTYVPVDIGRCELPERFRGVVFSNEFFDALPVEAAIARGGEPREMLVGWSGDRFIWVEDGRVRPEVEEYLRSYFPPLKDGRHYEVNLDALRWIDRIAACLETGYVLTIDYGYTRAESVRFPHGTLMSYRRHTALEDVLADPGERDITAHTPFTALQEYGETAGLQTLSVETLGRALLEAGEADQFASAIAGVTESERVRRRLQLKNLLFGMGETFRVLLQKRAKK